MHIRVQRIGRTEGAFTHHLIDDKLMEANIEENVRPGVELEIAFNRLGHGVWHTTKVTRVEYYADGAMHVYTKNSIYRILKGWEEN